MPTKKPESLSVWVKETTERFEQRAINFTTLSNLEIPLLATAETIVSDTASETLGFPGSYPYTRGVQPTMYRGRLWTMRQFAGFGSPEDTNARFHYLLEHGQTGLSTAFDMPTLMGYDADHEMAEGEVGREGVSVSTIEDMERLFAGIDLTKVTTSMTINCSAAPVMAMYFALGRRRGNDLHALGGTIQNDILKEYIAQKEWISPPESAVRIVCDVIEFCAASARKFHPVSISGYHIREAGSTAVQELAFTLYNGITYAEHCVARGLKIDSFAPMLSFFWDVHNDFFEEIAKFRAARRMWASIMSNRFGAMDPKSMRLKAHAQTAGVSLTAQQPLNNIARVALQALAAVLGGTQSLHTNSMDETLALPTEESVKVALRTQQIIAEETGVADTVDPLGGSYFVEDLTNRMEAAAWEYIHKLDSLGGMLKAIHEGFPQREIADASYRFQQAVDRQERKIVGVNCYADSAAKVSIPTLKIDPSIESDQRARVIEFKKKRDAAAVIQALAAIRNNCRDGVNLMPALIDAVDVGVTVGEVSDIYREVFDRYRDPGFL